MFLTSRATCKGLPGVPEPHFENCSAKTIDWLEWMVVAAAAAVVTG